LNAVANVMDRHLEVHQELEKQGAEAADADQRIPATGDPHHRITAGLVRIQVSQWLAMVRDTRRPEPPRPRGRVYPLAPAPRWEVAFGVVHLGTNPSHLLSAEACS